MLFVASFSFYIIGAVTTFFGISVQSYIFYFIFALAMGFLYFVLPQQRQNIFE
jgi:hypothetical protein